MPVTEPDNILRADVCPHVNRNDLRCASRFNLGRIEQAFCICFGAFQGCPMYHRINDEQWSARRAGPCTPLTISNHDAAALRPTGS